MALTPRQQQFLETLETLHRRTGRGVHYTAVAEILSVSPFSAYDMLKVLEQKGVVTSEYVLDGTAPGPGRSAIVFRPRATAAPGDVPVGGTDDVEWSGLRNGLLQRLAEVRDANVAEVLGEMLARLAEYTSPLSYCAGVIAALLVNLHLGGRRSYSGRQLQAVHVLVSNGEMGLGALAGLSIGSSLARRESPWLDSLLQSSRRFQVHLASLSQERRQRLAGFLREALSAIEATRV